MTLDKTNISLVLAATVAVGVVYSAFDIRSWADERHRENADDIEEVEDLAKEVKAQSDLLRLLVTQQATLVESLASDSKVNRETLIKIEAKIPAQQALDE